MLVDEAEGGDQTPDGPAPARRGGIGVWRVQLRARSSWSGTSPIGQPPSCTFLKKTVRVHHISDPAQRADDALTVKVVCAHENACPHGLKMQEMPMLTRRPIMMLVLAAVLGFAVPALADDVVDGRTGPGSVYRLIRPSNWNGILLLYAHGYVSKDEPVAISPDAQLVASLVVPQGFAVAVS